MARPRPYRLFSILILVLAVFVSAAERVYVVHGYGSKKLFMSLLADGLKKAGFDVVNFGYPSMSKDLRLVASELAERIVSTDSSDTVSFVTHSMGGIVARACIDALVKRGNGPVIKSIVMLTPPNSGSEIADFFAGWTVLDWAMGPNVTHMRTDTSSLVHHLPDLRDYHVGIITALRYPQDGLIFREIHDGLVGESRTNLSPASYELRIDAGHLSILYDARAHAQAIHFLRNGSFGEQW